MSNHPKICTEKDLPLELRGRAAAAALKENLENLPPVLQSSMVGVFIPRPFMALITGKKWARGRTIKVSFKGGTKTVIEKVKRYAKIWEKYAEIKFSFVTKGGTLRISFVEGDGSWSYVGTDALQIPSGQATMNFGWLDEATSDKEYSRVVLHEFGHALGCIHEHQHPRAGIPWDKPKVYAYYAKSGWSKADVDNNIFKKYSDSTTNFSSYDKKSIMHYAVPNELTKGDFEVPWNTSLSSTDKAYIAKIY